MIHEQDLRHHGASAIDALKKKGSVQHYSKGTCLFQEKEKPSLLYYLVDGVVSFSFYDFSGKHFTVGVASAGTFVGELELFNGQPRISQATALTACEVLSIPAAAFLQTLAESPPLMFAVLQSYSRNIEYLMRFSLTLNAEKRLASVLLALTERQSGSGHYINLSQEALAATIGKPRQLVNQILQGWKKKNIVDLAYRRIELAAPQALRALIER